MENKIIEADFRVVHERTLEVIATEIRTIDNHIYQVALNGAIEIGRRLEEAKEKVGHGNWENWCKENLNYTPSWAAKLMKIATEYGKENNLYLSAISKTDTCADLGISKAFRLLQVPENEVEEFAEENDISNMGVKELEEKIKELKAKNTNIDEVLANTRDQLEKAEKNFAQAQTDKLSAEEKLKDLQNRSEAEKDGELSEATKAEIERLTAEIEKKNAEIEKKKEAEKKLKEKLASAEAEKQKALEEEKEKIKAEAKAEAQKETEEKIKKLNEEAEDYAKAATEAERKTEEERKKLETYIKTDAGTRKARMDMISGTVQTMKRDIDILEDKAEQERQKNNLKAFLQSLAESV